MPMPLVKDFVRKVTLEFVYDVIDERTKEIRDDIEQLQIEQKDDFKALTARIDQVNSRIDNLQNQMTNLQNQMTNRLDQIMQMLADLKK